MNELELVCLQDNAGGSCPKLILKQDGSNSVEAILVAIVCNCRNGAFTHYFTTVWGIAEFRTNATQFFRRKNVEEKVCQDTAMGYPNHSLRTRLRRVAARPRNASDAAQVDVLGGCASRGRHCHGRHCRCLSG